MKKLLVADELLALRQQYNEGCITEDELLAKHIALLGTDCHPAVLAATVQYLESEAQHR